MNNNNVEITPRIMHFKLDSYKKDNFRESIGGNKKKNYYCY